MAMPTDEIINIHCMLIIIIALRQLAVIMAEDRLGRSNTVTPNSQLFNCACTHSLSGSDDGV